MAVEFARTVAATSSSRATVDVFVNTGRSICSHVGRHSRNTIPTASGSSSRLKNAAQIV